MFTHFYHFHIHLLLCTCQNNSFVNVNNTFVLLTHLNCILLTFILHTRRTQATCAFLEGARACVAYRYPCSQPMPLWPYDPPAVSPLCPSTAPLMQTTDSPSQDEEEYPAVYNPASLGKPMTNQVSSDEPWGTHYCLFSVKFILFTTISMKRDFGPPLVAHTSNIPNESFTIWNPSDFLDVLCPRKVCRDVQQNATQ